MDDSELNKLFVGGISWETSEDTLIQHFGKYGSVIGCVIAKDRNAGTSRGFAFISFSDSSAVDTALLDTHEILGRTVDVKKAIPRNEHHQNQRQSRSLNRNSRNSDGSNDQVRTKKIFVGGLSSNLTEEDFKSYFEKFGKITDVVVMHDNVSHRPRGFGFITFDSEDAVENVMLKNFHELSGRLVEVKRAVPKDGNNNSSNGYNARVGGGSERGYNFNSYQFASYPSYSPRYGLVPGYGPIYGYGSSVVGYPYGVGILGGGYPTGGYSGIGYEVVPLAPRSPWNGPAISPPSCGSAGTVYHDYLNGGVGIGAANGYSGILGTGVNGKLNQRGGGEAQVAAGTTRTNNNYGVSIAVNSSRSSRSYGTSASKQNQRDIDR